MAAPSPVGDVKIVFAICTFVLNTLTLKQSAFCLIQYERHLGSRVKPNIDGVRQERIPAMLKLAGACGKPKGNNYHFTKTKA